MIMRPFTFPAVVLFQMLLVTGGTNHGTVHTDSTEIFDPNLGDWRFGAALPSPMLKMTAINIDNRVLILGRFVLIDKIKFFKFSTFL